MAHSLLKPDPLTSISILTYAVIITTLINTALNTKNATTITTPSFYPRKWITDHTDLEPDTLTHLYCCFLDENPLGGIFRKYATRYMTQR